MGQINKGKIASIDGNTARVIPLNANGKPTAKITIPWHLREKTGQLKKDTVVVYAEFEDSTGLLLGRADGEWGEFLPYLKVDNLEATADVKAQSVSLKTHKHGGVETGGGSTSTPK